MFMSLHYQDIPNTLDLEQSTLKNEKMGRNTNSVAQTAKVAACSPTLETIGSLCCCSIIADKQERQQSVYLNTLNTSNNVKSVKKCELMSSFVLS